MTNMKFLITGCAGFIGSHALERVLADGHEAVGVDDFSTGKRENIAASKGRFELIEGDLCDPAIAQRAVRGVDCILHFASIPSVPRSLDKPVENLHSSVTSTVTMLDAAVKAGVKRVVQSTSSACYGDSAPLYKAEDQLPEPLSPYAVAKLAQEYYGYAFSASFGIDCVALRYFNVFGPRQDPTSEYSAVIPKFITLMLQGKHPIIFGDGTQSRDFIYVSNVIDGNIMAAQYPGSFKGQVFNLACGVRTDINELVAKLNNILETSLEPVYAPQRPGEILHSLADTGKAKRILEYSPRVDFEQGLRLTVDSFRKG